MATPVPLSEFMPYGAPELQGCAPRHLSSALLVSSALVTLAFALAGAGLGLRAPAPAVPPPANLIEWLDLPPPPRVALEVPRAPAVAPPAPRAGAIPVPVPDAAADPTQTIAEPDARGPGLPGAEPGTFEAFAPPALPAPADEALPVFGEHQVVDVLPNALRRVRPEYPDLARQAGVEGLVIVHALVGRDGRVVELRLDPGHRIPLLDTAAMDAVRGWRFTPALTNGRAVPAWVAVRLRFTLNDPEW